MAVSVRRDQRLSPAPTGVILCADDYALTNGISRAIIELAEARRISATSAMTTTPHWPSHATWLARARSQIAVGLHLNLTQGSPLTAMANLAPNRTFPGVAKLTALALGGRLKADELRIEIERQLSAFESELGFAPDHIDGHQHVHVLPIVRSALLDVLSQRFGKGRVRPLLRIPTDATQHIFQRGRFRSKALTLKAVSVGFQQAVRAAGFTSNNGFSGITDFKASGVDADFAAAARNLGTRHIVMCHPGFVDDELRRLDPVTLRRQNEFDALMSSPFPVAIWQPDRSATGGCIDWTRQGGPMM